MNKSFKQIVNDISESLNMIPYSHGDYSDIGNEIGIAIGETITDEELEDFIMGLKHGISIANGTHG